MLWQSKTYLETEILAGSKQRVEGALPLACPFGSDQERDIEFC